MERARIPRTTPSDNLDRLLGLLRAARADQDARPRVDLTTACRELLAAIDRLDGPTRVASPAA